MVREDQSIGNHYVFPPAGCEDYDFGDVVGRQGLASTIAKIKLVNLFDCVSRGESRLTRIRRLLWPCRRRTGRRRIPSIT